MTKARSLADSALTDGGTITGAQAIAVNTSYLVDCTASGYTLTGPSSATARDAIEFIKSGTNGLTINLNGLKFNGSATNPTSYGTGKSTWVYTGATTGWVEQ